MYACSSVYVHAHVHVQARGQHLPLSATTLFSKQSLLLNLELVNSASRTQGSLCLCHPRAGIKSPYTMPDSS